MRRYLVALGLIVVLSGATIWFLGRRPAANYEMESPARSNDDAKGSDGVTHEETARDRDSKSRQPAQSSQVLSESKVAPIKQPVALGSGSKVAVSTGRNLPDSRTALPDKARSSEAPIPNADPLSAATDQDLIALDKITLSLRDYRSVMRENPVGTNAEITSALNGGNPRGAHLLPLDSRINGRGELIDRWMTPYFFHQLSKDNMEIRSAGPDRQMWTQDDVIAH